MLTNKASIGAAKTSCVIMSPLGVTDGGGDY
jgi:hypothetical protein